MSFTISQPDNFIQVYNFKMDIQKGLQVVSLDVREEKKKKNEARGEKYSLTYQFDFIFLISYFIAVMLFISAFDYNIELQRGKL